MLLRPIPPAIRHSKTVSLSSNNLTMLLKPPGIVMGPQASKYWEMACFLGEKRVQWERFIDTAFITPGSPQGLS